MKKIFFDCSGNFYEGTRRCTREWLKEQLNSAKVLSQVETYRMLNSQDDKKALPILIPHATFTNGKRQTEFAVPSGLLMLDLDNHEGKFKFDPRDHYEQYIKPQLSTTLQNVLMVYVTVSGLGLRIIAKRTRCSNNLYQEQLELFNLLRGNLPDEALDNGCHDLTRPSFITSREDLLWLNEDELFDGEVTEGFAADLEAMNVAHQKEQAMEVQTETTETTVANRDSRQTTLPIRPEVAALISDDGRFFGEVSYSDITKELILTDRLALKQGSRNKDTYRLASQLRHICLSEQHLQQVMPHSGLSDKEVADTIHSACGHMTSADAMDPVLVRVLDKLGAYGDQEQILEPVMPTLPKGLREIVEPVSPSHRPAMVMCALPMLGALATRMRFRYLEDEVHSLSFQTVLVAEQGTGKGTMSKLHKLLMGKLIEQDDQNRAKMDDWRDEREAMGESAAGPRQPHLPVRNFNPKTTYPTMVQMMKDAKGQHLFVCAPEIDSVPNKEWFQNGSTLRLAFDNERGGQDTKSVKAVSGYIPFYLNACLSGTPSAVMNRYKNAEDGLVTRTLFTSFPAGERGKKRIPDQHRTPRNQKAVEKTIDMLMDYGVTNEEECNPVRLHKIERAILEWYDEMGDLYNMTKNEAIETFRTRDAVIGMRAGALAWLLEGKRESRVAIEFAVWVAQSAMYYHMKLFGEKVDEAVIENTRVLQGKAFTSNDMIFANVNDEFSNLEVTNLFQLRGKQGTGVSQTCHRWEENHWVERVGRGQWRKTTLGKERAELLKLSLAQSSV